MSTQNKAKMPSAAADKTAPEYIKTSSGWVRRLGNYESEPRIYRIIRFRFNGSPRTVRNNVTLTEAQAHCSRKDTSSHSTGNGAWFDGYDYMKGCKPKDVALDH